MKARTVQYLIWLAILLTASTAVYFLVPVVWHWIQAGVEIYHSIRMSKMQTVSSIVWGTFALTISWILYQSKRKKEVSTVFTLFTLSLYLGFAQAILHWISIQLGIGEDQKQFWAIGALLWIQHIYFFLCSPTGKIPDGKTGKLEFLGSAVPLSILLGEGTLRVPHGFGFIITDKVFIYKYEHSPVLKSGDTGDITTYLVFRIINITKKKAAEEIKDLIDTVLQGVFEAQITSEAKSMTTDEFIVSAPKIERIIRDALNEKQGKITLDDIGLTVSKVVCTSLKRGKSVDDAKKVSASIDAFKRAGITVDDETIKMMVLRSAGITVVYSGKGGGSKGAVVIDDDSKKKNEGGDNDKKEEKKDEKKDSTESIAKSKPCGFASQIEIALLVALFGLTFYGYGTNTPQPGKVLLGHMVNDGPDAVNNSIKKVIIPPHPESIPQKILLVARQKDEWLTPLGGHESDGWWKSDGWINISKDVRFIKYSHVDVVVGDMFPGEILIVEKDTTSSGVVRYQWDEKTEEWNQIIFNKMVPVSSSDSVYNGAVAIRFKVTAISDKRDTPLEIVILPKLP